MKKIVIKVDDNGKYKIFRFIRLLDNKNKEYIVLYKGKYYKKESNNSVIKQVTQLVEALNIKDIRKRITYIYNKACDILDNDFYGNNICEFKNNKCIQDRLYNDSYDGCCRNKNGLDHCIHLINHKCGTKCLPCKFHICSCLRKKGIKYKINDIVLLKYLLNWKQKIIIYLEFFKTDKEIIELLLKNSIITWMLKKEENMFINDNED